jgi:flavin-dependent dehydrogenase
VLVFSKKLSPGLGHIVRYPNGDASFSVFLSNPKTQDVTKELKDLHDSVLSEEPTISKVFNKELLSEAKVIPVRYGEIQNPFKDNLLIIGDAGGHVDPLTGFGIQYALEGAKIAAETIVEGFIKNDLTHKSLSKFADKCMKKFGKEMQWSQKIAKLMHKYPLFVDAMASWIQKRGGYTFDNYSMVCHDCKSNFKR